MQFARDTSATALFLLPGQLPLRTRNRTSGTKSRASLKTQEAAAGNATIRPAVSAFRGDRNSRPAL
jgi:hypothetical protein